MQLYKYIIVCQIWGKNETDMNTNKKVSKKTQCAQTFVR